MHSVLLVLFENAVILLTSFTTFMNTYWATNTKRDDQPFCIFTMHLLRITLGTTWSFLWSIHLWTLNLYTTKESDCEMCLQLKRC